MIDGPEPGYIRLYEDHTGRWYADVTELEYEQMCFDSATDPLVQTLMDEITKEIDSEVLDGIR